MHLSRFILLPLGLVLASPTPIPEPVPQPIAAPNPTPAARLTDSTAVAAAAAELKRRNHEKRQLAFTLLGASAYITNGVVCGGIGPITGCLGQPGPAVTTNVLGGTIRTSGGSVALIGGTIRTTGAGGLYGTIGQSGGLAGTVTQSGGVAGGTFTNSDFSVMFSIPVPTTSRTGVASATNNGAVARMTEVPAKAALAAGVGAVALGLL